MNVDVNNMSIEQLEVVISDLEIELEYKKMQIKINAFFTEYSQQIKFFKNFNINGNNINELDGEYPGECIEEFINALIKLYEFSPYTCNECDIARAYINNYQNMQYSDNLMCECLAVAYYYCVNAILEWLENEVI